MTHKTTSLLRAAARAAAGAYAPYSGYRVGAALRTPDGKVFTGANVENASYGLTLCAERAALAAAVTAGQRTFTALAVAASGPAHPYPCGACRQVLAEFAGPEFPVHTAIVGRLNRFETTRLGVLLPESFSLTARAKGAVRRKRKPA